MCNDDVKIIEQLKEETALLKEENRILKARIEELEKRLAIYENAHTPPSLRRGGSGRKNHKEGCEKKPGQKKGHKGVTRPQKEPDMRIAVTADRCPHCEA